MRQYRQGDLLFTEVSGIPPGTRGNTSPVLAYGEVTGHCHTLRGTFTRHDLADDVYIQGGEGCGVVHDEHTAIPLSPGKTYKMSRQRQHDPLTSIPRPVVD